MKYFILSLFISIGLSCSQCEPFQDEDVCPYYFQIPFEISPLQMEYHVGDTITISSKFHRKVPAFDRKFNSLGNFDMEGIHWYPWSFFVRLDTALIDSCYTCSIASKCFKIISNGGYNYNIVQNSDGATHLSGQYNYLNDSFRLEYKVICLESGLYLISNSSSLLSENNDQDFPGKCNSIGFDIITQMNNEGMNNLELMQESPYEIWNTFFWNKENTQQYFSNQGGYCFKVVP